MNFLESGTPCGWEAMCVCIFWLEVKLQDHIFTLFFCVLEYIPFFLISETWETWLLLPKEKEKGEAIAADIPSR